MKTQTTKQVLIEFPDHLQLHAMGADGNVEVKTVRKAELPLPFETKPEVNQPSQTI